MQRLARIQAILAGACLCVGLSIGQFLPSPELAVPLAGMIGATAGIVAAYSLTGPVSYSRSVTLGPRPSNIYARIHRL